MNGKVSSCWLTLNRACNLNCHWCYAKNATKQNMAASNAIKVIDFLPQIGVESIILIGGEPTVYQDLPLILQEGKKNQLDIGIVTNGVRLKDDRYLSLLIEKGVSHFGVSLKGYNRSSFIETTGYDRYDDVLYSIFNLAQSGIPFSVSFVLTKDNIPNIHLGIADAIKAVAKRVRLSFCYDFEVCRSDVCTIENPFTLAKLFMQYYPMINEACGGNMGLFQSLPFCVWDPQFIELLDSRNQLTSVCQVLQRNGLVIDTDMSIIPCNAMYDYKIGVFGTDFNDGKSFNEYWNSKDIVGFYNKLRALPDVTCEKCKTYQNCGGGCVSNWFNYSFEELMSMKDNA